MKSYERGSVPWGEIFSRAETGEKEGIIHGKSGLPLRYVVSGLNEFPPLTFSVREPGSGLHLKAVTTPACGFFSLSMRTRGFNGCPEKRHPDMYAAQFVGHTLELVKDKQGVELDTYQALWHNIPLMADNYHGFFDGYRKTGDMTYAAEQGTWTGRVITALGFSVLESSIRVDDHRVIAYFKRRK